MLGQWRTICLASSSMVILSFTTTAAVSQTPTSAAPTTIVKPLNNGVEAWDGSTLIRVTALTDQIIRVRVARDGKLREDASWAVPSGVRATHVTVTPMPDGFATRQVRIQLVGQPLRLRLLDLSGKIISSDAVQPLSFDHEKFVLRKVITQDEHIFGLGDKTGSDLDRRGMTYVDWNTDAFGYSSSQDPIYKSIPFFIGAGGDGGSYGLFLDNTWRSYFDFGHREAGIIEIGAPDGPIDYYLIAGPSTAEVVRRFTDLTGKAPLPPLWALGYQQSRYSYMSATEVEQIATRLRSDRVPTDVIWLDIDYQDQNRPFTVNTTTFPNLKLLSSRLETEGFQLVAIVDLHIADLPGHGYDPYDSGIRGNHFVHRPDGSVYVAPVWPGPSVFPDFTDHTARTWWGTLFKPLIADKIAGFWNDMNEPAVFDTPTKTMPLDVVHRIAGDDFVVRNARHAEIHNVYGMENSRATYDGLRVLRPNERAFVMTRASYAGGQRYAVTWTGDNSSTWDHLRLSVHQLINLGLSGFSYAGADVGGFAGGPSADLLTRWFEIAAFTPIFRDHSAKDAPRAEPWLDGPNHLAIRRRYVEERYRLMPYFYALSDLNSRTGDPIMRPVFYDYPSALRASCDQSLTFTLGKSLLIAPPPKMESPQSYDVCLPPGGWFDYWSGLPVTAKPLGTPVQAIQSATQTAQGVASPSLRLTETPKLDTLPIFVREGTILPRQPLVQSLTETPRGPLEMDVFPGDACSGVLYSDDGHSMSFQKAGFTRQIVSCSVSGRSIRLRFEARQGRFVPWWTTIKVTVHGWSGHGVVRLGPRIVESHENPGRRTIDFLIPAPSGPAELVVSAG